MACLLPTSNKIPSHINRLQNFIISKIQIVYTCYPPCATWKDLFAIQLTPRLVIPPRKETRKAQFRRKLPHTICSHYSSKSSVIHYEETKGKFYISPWIFRERLSFLRLFSPPFHIDWSRQDISGGGAAAPVYIVWTTEDEGKEKEGAGGSSELLVLKSILRQVPAREISSLISAEERAKEWKLCTFSCNCIWRALEKFLISSISRSHYVRIISRAKFFLGQQQMFGGTQK